MFYFIALAKINCLLKTGTKGCFFLFITLASLIISNAHKLQLSTKMFKAYAENTNLIESDYKVLSLKLKECASLLLEQSIAMLCIFIKDNSNVLEIHKILKIKYSMKNKNAMMQDVTLTKA